MGRRIRQSFISLCLGCKYYNRDTKYGVIRRATGDEQNISAPGNYCTKFGFFPETITLPRSIHNPIGAVPNVVKCTEFKERQNFYDEAERRINMPSLGATGPTEPELYKEAVVEEQRVSEEVIEEKKEDSIEVKFDRSGQAELHTELEVEYLMASGKKFLPDVDFEVDETRLKWKNSVFNPTVFVHPKIFFKK